MKELCPNKRSDPIPYSATVQECLDKDDDDVGLAEIKDGGKISLIVKGSSLEIINLQNGCRNASFSFDNETSNWRVTCFCPYQGKYLISLSAAKINQQKGLLCVYDPGVSRIIKAIQLPYKPTSVCLLKEYGGAGDKYNFVSGIFKSMFGIAIVGTYAGHLYLIDLRGDDKQEFFPLSNPSSLLSVELSKVSRISEFRELAFNNGKHCCIDLNYDYCSYQGFRYVNPSNRLSKTFKTESSGVTALKFIPQTLTLAVGYEFGCYQLWSMKHLNLLFCTVFGNDVSAAVTHFVFQEPDDDPRSCCYLWVGRAALCTNNNVYMGPTTLSLYQILYEEKEFRPGYGNIYKDYECVIKRFSHQLTADAYHLVDSQSPGSRIVTFKTLGSSSTLCYVVWETCVNDDLTCHLGIFDLNRWYQKQLPGSLRDAMFGRMEAVCPFFAFYSLTDIAEELLPSSILDVHIYEDSINTFQNVVGPQSEQFYWPSSATFSLRCVSEASSVELDMLGIQRQIMADSRKQGTESFVDAQSIVQNCWIAGLLQNTADIVRSSEDKRNTDTLLSIHLEHDGINFITTCIKKWAHGSITHAGHSLKLIYDWAWNHVIHVKKNLDHLYINLFDTLSSHMETEHKNTVKKMVMDLKQLGEIFRELQRADALTTQSGAKELKTREKITNYLHLYCNILVILVDIGLLPEPSPSINTTKDLSYPYDILSKYYEEQRKELTQSSKNMSSVEGNSMFIDLISSDFIHQNSPSNGDNPTMQSYPPQTIEAMCQTFVENCRDDDNQIMLFYYWMLDVCECYEELQKPKVSKKFKDCLQLPSDKCLLVESLWLIDHRLYKDAVEHLALVESKISSYYYTHIVRTLYHVKELHLLTTFCSCKEPVDFCTYDELKLLIKVFLKLKLLDNAYKLQAKFNSKSKKALLFAYFVEQCKLNKVLGKLVTLAFTAEEEELLRRILKNSKDIQDYLLVFYLERGLYHEASNMTKDMRSSGKWQNLRSNLLQGTDDRRFSKKAVLDGFDTKGLLVDGFIQTVPSIEQKKLNLFETRSPNTSFRSNERQPLSTVYRTASKRTRNDAHGSDILSTLQYHDISASSENGGGGLFNSSGFNIENLGNSSQRRRKSPLFDGEILTSPKKKAKEAPVHAALLPSTPPRVEEKLRFAKELTSRQKKDLYQGADAFLLLNTPPVVRRMKTASSVATTIDPLKTPQSILKSRTKSKIQKINFSTTNIQQQQDSPPSAVNVTESEKTPYRKIRFTGLSPTSPLTPNNEVSVSSHDDLMSHMKSIDSSSHEDQLLSELSRELEDDEVIEDNIDEGDELNKTPMESILLDLSQDDDDDGQDDSIEESSPITSSTSIVREAVVLQLASPYPSSRTNVESSNTEKSSKDVLSALFETRETSVPRERSLSPVMLKERTPSPISANQDSSSNSPVVVKERTPSPSVSFEEYSHSPVTFNENQGQSEVARYLSTPSVSEKTVDEENAAEEESFDDFQSPLQYSVYEKEVAVDKEKEVSIVMLDDSSDEENERKEFDDESEEESSEEEEDEEEIDDCSEGEDESEGFVEQEISDNIENEEEEYEGIQEEDDTEEDPDVTDDFVLAEDEGENSKIENQEEYEEIQDDDAKEDPDMTDDDDDKEDFNDIQMINVDDEEEDVIDETDLRFISGDNFEMVDNTKDFVEQSVKESVAMLEKSPQMTVDEDSSVAEVDNSVYEDAPGQSAMIETSNHSANQTNASSIYKDVDSKNVGNSPLRGQEEHLETSPRNSPLDVYDDILVDEDVKLYEDLDTEQSELQQNYIFNTDIEGKLPEPALQQDEDFAIVSNTEDDLPRQTESAEYVMIPEAENLEVTTDSRQVIAISSEESLVTENQMISDIDDTLHPELTSAMVVETEPKPEDTEASPKESFEMIRSAPSVQSLEDEPENKDEATTPSKGEENMNKTPLLFQRLLTENYSNDSTYTDVSESVSSFSAGDASSPEQFVDKNVVPAAVESVVVNTEETQDVLVAMETVVDTEETPDVSVAMETEEITTTTEVDTNENLDVSVASGKGKRQLQPKTPVRLQPPRRVTTRSASKKKSEDNKMEESILNEIYEESEQYRALEGVNRALVVEVPTTHGNRRSSSKKKLEASVPMETITTELTGEGSEDSSITTVSKRRSSKKKSETATPSDPTAEVSENALTTSVSTSQRSSEEKTKADKISLQSTTSEPAGQLSKDAPMNTASKRRSKKKTETSVVLPEPIPSESTWEIYEDASTNTPSTRRSSRRKTIQTSEPSDVETKQSTLTTPIKKPTTTTTKTTPRRSPSRRSVNASISEPMLVISPVKEENNEETTTTTRKRRTPLKKTTKSTPNRSPSRRGVTATVSEPALCILPILEEVIASDDENEGKLPEEDTLTKVIAKAEQAVLEESTVSNRTRRRSAGRNGATESKSAETLVATTTIKTKNIRGRPPKVAKESVSHESVLSFMKQSSSSEIEENDPTSVRTSQRSSSKRASIAISGLSRTRTRK